MMITSRTTPEGRCPRHPDEEQQKYSTYATSDSSLIAISLELVRISCSSWRIAPAVVSLHDGRSGALLSAWKRGALRSMDPLILARFAPLPAPFLAHLRTKRLRVDMHTPRWLTQDALAAAHAALAAAEQALLVQFDAERDALDGDLASMRITSRVLRELTGIAPATLAAWRRRGLLVRQRHGLPDRANAVAIILMRRLLPDAQRDWLPAGLSAAESSWWCVQVSGDTGDLVPVPVTSPGTGTRVTRWTGAAYIPDAGWVALPDGGAAHLAGTTAQALNQAQRIRDRWVGCSDARQTSEQAWPRRD